MYCLCFYSIVEYFDAVYAKDYYYMYVKDVGIFQRAVKGMNQPKKIREFSGYEGFGKTMKVPRNESKLLECLTN